jgi:hypothetical protein
MAERPHPYETGELHDGDGEVRMRKQEQEQKNNRKGARIKAAAT